MDQRSVVLYLVRKGLAAVAIHEDLVATLGAEAISYAWVTCYLREAKFATSKQEVTFLNRSVNMMITTKLSCSPEMNNHLHQYEK
jgi:hypothetical protein